MCGLISSINFELTSALYVLDCKEHVADGKLLFEHVLFYLVLKWGDHTWFLGVPQ